MDYKKFLIDNLGEYFDNITDEININTSGNVMIVKELTGTIYKSSQILPIQLQVFTKDINGYMDIMRNFARSAAGTVITQGLNYVKQHFETPQVLNAWSESADNYYATIVLNGILIVSSNISDIKTVEIDGELIEFDEVNLIYAAAVDTNKLRKDNLSKSRIIGGANTLNISVISQSNYLLQKVRRVVRGEDKGNIKFNIKITYIDDDYVEEYVMVLNGRGLTSSSSGMPLETLTFTE